jgi:hypothetical protein
VGRFCPPLVVFKLVRENMALGEMLYKFVYLFKRDIKA